jgi:hypothetical protein
MRSVADHLAEQGLSTFFGKALCSRGAIAFFLFMMLIRVGSIHILIHMSLNKEGDTYEGKHLPRRVVLFLNARINLGY